MPRNMKLDYKDIDDYISQQSETMQKPLKKIRNLVKRLVPEATEHISYGMPTFKLNKVLIHFAIQKTHIGLYPGPKAIEHFSDKLASYSTSKGTIRFDMDQPLPIDLISAIVEFNTQLIRK